MAETLFEELKRYVGFSAGGRAGAARPARAGASPTSPASRDVFYDRILEHEGARKALEGGESQVGHLKVTLQALDGAAAARPLGRGLLRAALPHRPHARAHRPAAALHVRRDERAAAGAQRAHRRALRRASPSSCAAARVALGKILDLELAIMLHTYREDLLAQQARSERLSTFGQLVGSIGHELRNPLGVIETSLFILKGRPGRRTSAPPSTWIASASRWASPTASSPDLLDMIRDRPLQARAAAARRRCGRTRSPPCSRPRGVPLRAEGLEALPHAAGRPGAAAPGVRQPAGERGAGAWASRATVCAERPRPAPDAVELVLEDTGPG